MDVLFRVRARLGQLPIHLILWVLLLLALLPVGMMLIQGGKTTQQFEANQWGISWPYHLDGYVRMFRGLYKTILNTLFICAVAISVSLGLASYSSYVFARFKFPGREALYYLIIGLMMVPFIVSVVPQYRLMHKLGILDSRWALILPYIAGGSVFGVFLLRPFLASIPEELFEAARIDGAGDWQTYFLLALPLSLPILTTLVILLLLGQWNDIFWPAITIQKKELYTVTLAIWSIARGNYDRTMWGGIFSSFVIASLPIMILFFATRNLFIRGLSSGALKM